MAGHVFATAQGLVTSDEAGLDVGEGMFLDPSAPPDVAKHGTVAKQGAVAPTGRQAAAVPMVPPSVSKEDRGAVAKQGAVAK